MIAETLSMAVPYTPLLIFIAAFIDVFFVTGLFLYGGLLVTSVLGLILGGFITPVEVFLAASLGTLAGGAINFYAGYSCKDIPMVQRFLKKPIAQRILRHTTERSLFATIVIARFITLARPLYGIVLGAQRTSPARFFAYEIPIVIGWTLIWLVIILQGEKLLRFVFM